MFGSRISAGGGKTTKLGSIEYFYVVLRHGRSCQKVCGTDCELQLHALLTINARSSEIRGKLSDVRSQIDLKCLYLARIGRLGILLSVSKLARAITKWTRACGKRLARLISDIHFTSDYNQYSRAGNIAQQCRPGLFQDSDFAGDLEVSKSTSSGTLCIFVRHTLFPRSWMCKKETCVSHSSTESDITYFYAGLRMDGIPALDLWDLVIGVLHSNSNQKQKFKQPRSDPRSVKHQRNSRNHLELSNVVLDSSNVNPSHEGAMLYIFEDSEAVIKMIIKRQKSHFETCFHNPQSCS